MKKPCLFVVLILLAALLLPAAELSAQIPRTLSYQGVLTDATGNPRPDGSYLFTFRLYEAATGGSAIWTEAKTLLVSRGLFYTALGDQVPIPDAVTFDRPYWLSLQVAAEPELSPRTSLTTVGYSFTSIRSDTAEFARSAPDRFGEGRVQGLFSSAIPTTETPAWSSATIQTPDVGFIQATATVTINLTDATGCPCQFRGALFLTGQGYMGFLYTDVTLSVVDEHNVLAMTAGIGNTSGGTKTVEVRLFRLTGSGAASGYGNVTALYLPVVAGASASSSASVQVPVTPGSETTSVTPRSTIQP